MPKKKQHEILTSWWEYFSIILWGFFPPLDEDLLGRNAPSRNEIENKYKEKIEQWWTNSPEGKKEEFKEFVKKQMEGEEERKKTIENKAQLAIGQTSIVISILIAAISISSSQNHDLFPYQRIVVWIFFFILLLNIITVGLHARHALIITRGYFQESSDLYLATNSEIDVLVEQIFVYNRNSYINDVKGTYLKCAHWFFKSSFSIALIMSLLLPPILIFSYFGKESTQSTQQVVAPVINKLDSTYNKGLDSLKNDSLINNKK